MPSAATIRARSFARPSGAQVCHWPKSVLARSAMASTVAWVLAPGDGGHHRSVRDAQFVDATHSQLRVDDRRRVGADPAGAYRVVIGVSVTAQIVAQLGFVLHVGPGECLP